MYVKKVVNSTFIKKIGNLFVMRVCISIGEGICTVVIGVEINEKMYLYNQWVSFTYE